MDILTIQSTTATTVAVSLSDAEEFGEGYTITLYDSSQSTVLQTAVTATTTGFAMPVAIFTGLTPNTTYSVYYAGAGYESFTTLTDNPKVATESQWVDLASRVKAKSDVVITMTTTDPGEGAPLAANHFIGVYQ